MKCDEKSLFSKTFGQRVPIIIIFMVSSFGFLLLNAIELAGISLGVAVILGKDYATAITDEKKIS